MKKVLRLFVAGTFVIYLFVLFCLVFMGSRGFWRDMSVLEYALARMNLVPFRTIFSYISAIRNETMNLSIPITNLFGNLLMFLPMGLYLPLLFKKMNSWKKYLMLILAILFCIEVMQLLTKRGSFDIDDFILNMSGAAIGFVIWKTTLARTLRVTFYD